MASWFAKQILNIKKKVVGHILACINQEHEFTKI